MGNIGDMPSSRVSTLSCKGWNLADEEVDCRRGAIHDCSGMTVGNDPELKCRNSEGAEIRLLIEDASDRRRFLLEKLIREPLKPLRDVG